jgi:hypothetical protein
MVALPKNGGAFITVCTIEYIVYWNLREISQRIAHFDKIKYNNIQKKHFILRLSLGEMFVKLHQMLILLS